MERQSKPLLKAKAFIKNKLRSLKLQISVFFTTLLSSICYGTPLKDDEEVWFFPTSANQKSEIEWNIPIHHWVFENEEKSISRKATQKLLSEIIESLGVGEQQAESEIVKQRLMWFLVDNERKKNIDIDIQGITKKLNLTAPNGHAKTDISVQIGKIEGRWIRFKVVNLASESSEYIGEVQLIPDEGMSVISDIDDTIKISEVLDKKALLKNTFVNPYKTTQGFPEYYKSLYEQGAYFHYVSASPWQIQPSLKPFMEENYPKGSIALRDFRLKDSSFLSFLNSSKDYKIEQIKNIIERFPKHQFILIGDSGEYDPDVYAEIYRLFPNHVKSIQIRAVEGSDLSETRFQDVFKSVPSKVWRVSKNPLN